MIKRERAILYLSSVDIRFKWFEDKLCLLAQIARKMFIV